MRIKHNAAAAWLAHFSSFPTRLMHLSNLNYRSITQLTEPLRKSAAEGQVEMIAHREMRNCHLSIFTLVFQRELKTFTWVDSSGEKIIFLICRSKKLHTVQFII